MSMPPPGVLLALGAVALVAGLARGFSGFGGALIFVPLASALVGPQVAVPLLLIVDGFATLGMIPAAWRGADRRDVGLLALGALLGAPAGTLVLAHTAPTALRWGICALAAAMLALLASGWRYHGRPRRSLSLLVGTASGFCAGAAQIGGPPVVAYWLGGALPARRARANIVLFFAATSVVNTTTYILGGLLGGSVLTLAVVTAPTYALGIWTGSRLFGRANETVFRRACLALIGAAALIGLPVWRF